MSDGGIAFFGASALGYRACESLFEWGLPVRAIFTMPEEFSISYSPTAVRNVLFRDFGDLGRRYEVPVRVVESSRGEYEDVVRGLAPDLIIVVGWYFKVPESVRKSASHGCVGVHASILPRYRGGAPLVWALINGEPETGVTLFHLSEGIDEGDIVGQDAFAIGPRDTIRNLLEKAEQATIALLDRHVPQLLARTAPRSPQDHRDATYFPQRAPSDGLINWEASPEEIDRFIRAQTRPYPGAFTYLGGKRVTIWAADIEPG